MGEAKRRGNQDQRAEQAKNSLRALLPKMVTCNNCKAELTEIEPLDVRGMGGMRAAGAANCKACQHDTWVLDGTSEGIEMFQAFLHEQHGTDAVSTGTAVMKE